MLRILLISAGAILETLFIMRSYRRRDGMSVFLKTAASLVFVLLGLLELRRTGTSVYGELVVVGLTLGVLGDLLRRQVIVKIFCFHGIGRSSFLRASLSPDTLRNILAEN